MSTPAWNQMRSNILKHTAFMEERSEAIARAVKASGRAPIGKIPVPEKKSEHRPN